MTRQGNRRTDAGRSRRWPAIAAAGAVVVAGIALSQSSTAFWNDAKDTQALQIVAGTTNLEISSPTASSTLISPGATVTFTGGRFALTGDMPLTLTITRSNSDAFAAALIVRVGIAQGGGVCTPGTQVISSVPLGLVPLGTDAELCASVTAPATLPGNLGKDAQTSITLTFEGVQQ